MLTATPGYFWGDWRGEYVYAGMVRMCAVHHSIFALNSLAHWLREAPSDDRHSARDPLSRPYPRPRHLWQELSQLSLVRLPLQFPSYIPHVDHRDRGGGDAPDATRVDTTTDTWLTSRPTHDRHHDVCTTDAMTDGWCMPRHTHDARTTDQQR